MEHHMSSISAYYVEAITETQQDATMGSRPMTAKETEAFRAFYVEAMSAWEENKVNKDEQVRQNGWEQTRALFDQVLADVEERLRENGTIASRVVSDHGDPIVLRVHEQNYSFPGNVNSITIGRIPFTDIVLTTSGSSRLHAVVRRFGDQLVVMDVGSFYGIVLRERTNEESPCEASVPGDRRPLIVGADEHAVFTLGPNETLTVNPKECIIMTEQCTGTRNFRGQCGHFICCVECAEEWRREGGAAGTLCPECRAPFFGNRAARGVEHVMTNAFNLHDVDDDDDEANIIDINEDIDYCSSHIIKQSNLV